MVLGDLQQFNLSSSSQPQQCSSQKENQAIQILQDNCYDDSTAEKILPAVCRELWVTEYETEPDIEGCGVGSAENKKVRMRLSVENTCTQSNQLTVFITVQILF